MRGHFAPAMTFQNLLLLANLVLIAWYLVETRKLREAAEHQVRKSHEQLVAMQRQVVIARDQQEAQIRPALTVIGVNNSLLIQNIGSGPALNLQLVKGREQSVFLAASKVDTNFGNRAKGCCVAPGQTQDTGASVGSIGQLRGEDLQLVYESLSGNRYISMIEFDGPGNPCRTTLHVP